MMDRGVPKLIRVAEVPMQDGTCFPGRMLSPLEPRRINPMEEP